MLARPCHEPVHHGRRGEQRDAGPAPAQREDLRRLEVPLARESPGSPPAARAGSCSMPEPCDSGAACRTQSSARDLVHVGEVAQRHGEDVPVRDHHAFGPAGGPAGVEQPRHVFG